MIEKKAKKKSTDIMQNSTKNDAKKTPKTPSVKLKQQNDVKKTVQKKISENEKITTKNKKIYQGNRITVTQYTSATRRNKKQKKILRGIGVSKIGHTIQIPDTKEFRGMVEKIPHLVKIINNK